MTRDEFFAASKAELAALYLSDPDNPYQQSGRSSGAARWEETRRCLTDAVDRPGSFLDVGCANGLLLEAMAEWLGELVVEPFGVDFIPELVELARRRVPNGVFWVGNAWSWTPPHQFTYVRTNLEYVPAADQAEFVARQRAWVEPEGRLIVCHYRGRGETLIDTAGWLRERGYIVAGSSGADGVSLAWMEC